MDKIDQIFRITLSVNGMIRKNILLREMGDRYSIMTTP